MPTGVDFARLRADARRRRRGVWNADASATRGAVQDESGGARVAALPVRPCGTQPSPERWRAGTARAAALRAPPRDRSARAAASRRAAARCEPPLSSSLAPDPPPRAEPRPAIRQHQRPRLPRSSASTHRTRPPKTPDPPPTLQTLLPPRTAPRPPAASCGAAGAGRRRRRGSRPGRSGPRRPRSAAACRRGRAPSRRPPRGCRPRR